MVLEVQKKNKYDTKSTQFFPLRWCVLKLKKLKCKICDRLENYLS